MIAKCTCPNKGQDKLNGKGNRVFNPTKVKSGDKQEYRCTSCLRTRTL